MSADTLTAEEAARRVAACLAEAGYPDMAADVGPNHDEPDYPVVWRPIGAELDEQMCRTAWRAFFLIGRRSLACWDCWYAATQRWDHSVVEGCEHPAVWA